MKKQVLLVGFVAALSLTTVANANSYNVRGSNGSSCSQSESTGRSVEFGTSFDSATNEATLSATWTFELGREKLKNVDCNRLYDVTIQKERLELDKARLELELLRAQIKAAKNGTPQPKPIGDDW